MSERTAAALARMDTLLPQISALSASGERDQLEEEAQSLRRAIAAFHMEAIRFRMYNVDRLLKVAGAPETTAATFEALRVELETAGFHTRSHTAP
ncbi:MAG: hypothetical protein ABI634_15760 [Acidobacteriota bacterium]